MEDGTTLRTEEHPRFNDAKDLVRCVFGITPAAAHQKVAAYGHHGVDRLAKIADGGMPAAEAKQNTREVCELLDVELEATAADEAKLKLSDASNQEGGDGASPTGEDAVAEDPSLGATSAGTTVESPAAMELPAAEAQPAEEKKPRRRRSDKPTEPEAAPVADATQADNTPAA